MIHHAQDKIVVATVLLLDLVAYSRASVDTQADAKGWLNKAITSAFDNRIGADVIVSDTGDGAAISFLSNPEDALRIAHRLLDAALSPAEFSPPLGVRMGISTGPLRIVKDFNSNPNVLGDAINNAHRIMSFALPGEVLVSSDYFNLLKRLSNLYELHFLRRGYRRDKHGLRHELYVMLQGHQDDTDSLWSSKKASGVKRWGLALVLVLLFLGIADALFNSADRPPPREISFPILDEGPLSSPPISTRVIEPLDVIPPTPISAPVSEPMSQPEPLLTGLVLLAVSPWGEVFVDGEKKVLVPPENNMSLLPGTYNIEIRNKAQSYKTRLEVRPGMTQKIQYKFN